MAVDFSVNYLAVIVAALAALVIGFVYYGPAGIAYPFQRALGSTRPQAGRPGPVEGAIGAVVALVNAWVLALLSLNLGGSSIADGVMVGILVWLGFGATLKAAQVAFEKRSWSWWVVDNVHDVIIQAVMAAIVTVWR